MKNLYVAKMKCVDCGTLWIDLPRGPSSFCPKNCGSKYFEWLNYEETFGQHAYTELGDWNESYGKLTGKQTRKLLNKAKL